MDLMHNQAIQIIGDKHKGIYRVILDEPSIGKTILVRLDPEPTTGGQSKGGRKRLDNPKNPRKKALLPNVGELIWMERPYLEELDQQKLLLHVEIEIPNKAPTKPYDPEKYEEREKRKNDLFQKRVKAMEPFLSLKTLREHIDAKCGIADLVRIAMENSKLSKSAIYKLFSILCRYGFSENSLQLDYDKCGAPKVPRPCDPGGRKKPGAKTTKQKLAREQGIILEPDQPAMSSDWTARILAADKTIPTPKPAIPDRVTRIISSAFVTKYRQDKNGKLVEIDPKQGSYPNRRQIKRVLEREIPRIQRLIEKTTSAHFDRSLRGMTSKSWKGVAGPGHTWAIDSTVGDIYLRSSINRAWIIGRPIVYIIVDVWSTAIVGFYVCLCGPSWDMAKLALFSAGADPTLIGSLWEYEPVLSLDPAPTLCADLLCDRGEYLSIGAKQTGIELLPGESYTPPYRPDLKGLVEVLHRIAKDKQYLFVPGAIDARRKEFDLRRFNPLDAVFTVRDLVLYLHTIFAEYNLSANRESRLDAHMKAANVVPSPAGLWYWGHNVGIGMRRAVPFSELITSLLPSAEATVTRSGVMLGNKHYESNLINEQQWSTYARNFGSWKIPTNYFPGSVSTIWTPNTGQSGLIQLDLSDQSTASPELTWDEVLDAEKYYAINNAEREHQRTMTNLAAHRNAQEIIKNATQLTQEAIERDTGSKPNISEARDFEKSLGVPLGSSTVPDNQSNAEPATDEAELAYLDAMRNLLETNTGKGQHNGQ